MELFSEIYGAYFRTAGRILSAGTISAKEIQCMIQEEAFRDSMLFLPQKLMPDTPESWGLLRKREDSTLERVTHSAPPSFLTLLQKRWLKSKLTDPKMQLFLSDAELAALEEQLGDVQPLYPAEIFRYFDRFGDGDPYDDPHYRRIFRMVLEAMARQETAAVDYISGSGKALQGVFLPLRMEYSRKNDKFRVLCCRAGRHGTGGTGVLNIGRITDIRMTGRQLRNAPPPEEVLSQRRCREPVQVLVSGERNGIERFLMEFSAYEKHTEWDAEHGRCMVQLWYDTQDETEVLIRLLGFGPVLEILGPPAFRAQAAERVERQYALLGDAAVDGGI